MKPLMFLAAVLVILASAVSAASDDIFPTTTADGLTLQLLRYRPGPAASFNEGAPPVLLFPALMCNLNEYRVHTPQERAGAYGSMTLPATLADWAVDDPWIAEDPLRYYSILHYLWRQGYDPWAGNYRGTGRGALASQRGSPFTNIDVWITLDAPALVDKVREITHQDPFIGGHSTGGFVSYGYLQGAVMDIDRIDETGLPHVRQDKDLAASRNAHIRGFVGLDPAGIPPLPAWSNIEPLWMILGTPLYLDLDALFASGILPDGPWMVNTANLLLRLLFALDEHCAPFIELFGYLLMLDPDRIDPCVEDYFFRHGVSGSYLQVFSQYYDLGMNLALREHWKNGEENHELTCGPPRTPDDGYYYYDRHMDVISAPTLCFFSEYDSLVSAEWMDRDLIQAKTPHPLDASYILAKTAHAEVPFSRDAPSFTFPTIGVWLDEVCAMTTDTPDTAAGETVPAVPEHDDDDDRCFIAAARR